MDWGNWIWSLITSTVPNAIMAALGPVWNAITALQQVLGPESIEETAYCVGPDRVGMRRGIDRFSAHVAPRNPSEE